MTSSTKTNSTIRSPSPTYPPIPKIIEFRRYTAKIITEMLKNDHFLTHLMTSSLEKKFFSKNKKMTPRRFICFPLSHHSSKSVESFPSYTRRRTDPRKDTATICASASYPKLASLAKLARSARFARSARSLRSLRE